MSDVFNTGSKIGIDSLDQDERKKLFNKFVEAGGQVVTQKKKNLLNFDRERQKQLLKKIEARHKNGKNISQNTKKQHIQSAAKSTHLKRRDSIFDKTSIYFKGLFNGVTTLSGKYISKRFFKFIKYSVMPDLDKLDISLNYVLASKDEIIQRIINSLDEMGENYTDVFEKFLQFYSAEEFNGLLYFYNNEKYKKVPLKLIEEPFKKIFKKLYIFRNHFLYIYPAIKNALLIISRHRGWEKKVIANRLWIAKHTIDTVSTQLIKKFHILSLFYIKENVPLKSKKIKEFLNITKEDEIGYHKLEEFISKNKKELSEYFESTKDAVKKDSSKYLKKFFSDLTIEEISKLDIEEEVIEGFKLIKEINLDTINEYEIKNSNLSLLKEKDKVLELYILLKEFEREYSFILTSHRISIKPIFEGNKRVDYKDKMNTLYSKLNTIYETITDYTEQTKTLLDLENDEALNPINKFNRITAVEGKRSKLSFEIRQMSKKYFGEVYEIFTKIITDYNTKKIIVENPDDTIKFNTEIEGEKKLNGSTIINAFITASRYLAGVLYRLEDYGDFAGIKTKLRENEWPIKDKPTESKETEIPETAAEGQPEEKNDDLFDEIEAYMSKDTVSNNNETAN